MRPNDLPRRPTIQRLVVGTLLLVIFACLPVVPALADSTAPARQPNVVMLVVDNLDDLPEPIRRIKTNRSRIHQRLEEMGLVKDAVLAYLAATSYADAMLGRVLDALDKSPHADNTIVVLWSDHGYHHGEKGDWGKHTLWERTSNVPFLVAGPGLASNRMVGSTVSLIDMYPTFIDLCGLEPVDRLDGVSLAGILRDPTTAEDRSVLVPWLEPNAYAIVNKDWRYIHYENGTEELYDQNADPHEWNNLAVDPAYAEVKADLAKQAPKRFAEPQPNFPDLRLIIEGETFYWQLKKKADEPGCPWKKPTMAF